MLELIDGQTGIEQIAQRASISCGRTLDATDIAFLIDERLRPAGLIRQADGKQPPAARPNTLLGLKGRVAVATPRITSAMTAPLAWLFRPQVVAVTLIAFVVSAFYIIVVKQISGAIDAVLTDPVTLVGVVAATIASAAFHELGHAAACRYSGARPGQMGAALYLVWPVFYTDVTESYSLSRRDRLRVDLGGLYFNAIFSVVTFGMWQLTREEGLLVANPPRPRSGQPRDGS